MANLKNWPPLFMSRPAWKFADGGAVSKAALADAAWNLAARCAESADDAAQVEAILRKELDLVLAARKQHQAAENRMAKSAVPILGTEPGVDVPLSRAFTAGLCGHQGCTQRAGHIPGHTDR